MNLSSSPSFRRLAVAGLGALCAMTAGCGGEEPAPGDEYVTISAVELGRAYEESPATAQEQYGKRRLRVTGMVTNVTTDFADHAVIKMRGPTELIDLHFTLLEEAKAQAEQVRKGSEATLLCEGATLVIGSPTLDGCIVEGAPAAQGQ